MTLSRVGDLKEWPDNEWVRLAACLPGSRDLFLYSQNGWEKIELPAELELPAAAESENVYMGRDTTIPVHYISGRQ
jgi:hypothetical protein